MPALPLPRAASNLLASVRYRVEGSSMWPTLTQGQHVLGVAVNSATYKPERGDIVVLRHPLLGEFVSIKRIIGLPNEHVQLTDDGVNIDGIFLPEPYLQGPAAPANRYARQWFTGPDEYFLLGDNRSDSLDSRFSGPISLNCILGRVWFRCWPLRAMGTVKGQSTRTG